MTCIVGLVDGGRVYLGADSAGVAGWQLQIRKDTKIFVNDGYAMGFTTSFRMGQLLAYSFTPPVAPKTPSALLRFMSTEFVNAARTCLKDGGYAMKENEAEKAGEFLVGVSGRLFFFDRDYQVGEIADNFWAIGCGGDVALGALHATCGLRPKERVMKALKISEKCNAGVRGPFHIVSV
jgi:hypothetical protein